MGRPIIHIIAESLTGNTYSFIDYIKKEYPEQEFQVISPREINKGNIFPSLLEGDKVIIGCYTWDMGKIPIQTKKFVIENRDVLLRQKVLIYGTGWSIYEHFCGAVDGLSTILDHKFPTIKYELRFDPSVEKEAVQTLKQFMEE